MEEQKIVKALSGAYQILYPMMNAIADMSCFFNQQTKNKVLSVLSSCSGYIGCLVDYLYEVQTIDYKFIKRSIETIAKILYDIKKETSTVSANAEGLLDEVLHQLKIAENNCM